MSLQDAKAGEVQLIKKKSSSRPTLAQVQSNLQAMGLSQEQQ